MSAPDPGTEAYRWWMQGAKDEVAARKEDLSKDAWEAMECIGAMARLHPEASPADLLRSVAAILDGKGGTAGGLVFGQPAIFSVAPSTDYEHGHPAHLCTHRCPLWPKPSPRIQIVVKPGSAHLLIVPLEMMPLPPGSYEAELVVDG